MRVVYLCAVNPPPPHSDWETVRSFLKDIPEYLQPRDNKNNSPHICLFADRIGSDWLPEFHDFAVAFLSKNFLTNESALKCLSRAKSAFPNMICIDLFDNLTKDQIEVAKKYSNHILSLEEGKAFLTSTLPEISASYDLEEKRLEKSIESDGYKYLDETIADLNKQAKQHCIISWICYISSLGCLVFMFLFAYLRFLNLAVVNEAVISIPHTIISCVEIVILSILTVSISRFLFLLGKSFMVERIRCVDRAHAIGFGRLYLQLYKGKFKWDELKDVLKNWNIDNGSAFINMDAKDIEAVSLDKVASLFKGGS